jgi:AraC family transcriptional regulator
MSFTSDQQRSIAAVTSPPVGWRAQSWGGGRFVTARRERTAFVEGSILLPDHTVMVTLRGGAVRHETICASGERSDGPDRAGLASFLPAGCERRLRLHDVGWRWASISIEPALFERLRPARAKTIRPFGNREDAFLLGLLGEFERLHAADGALDATYCETMTLALVHYLWRREADEPGAVANGGLPRWKLARVRDHVEAHLAGEIRIGALAELTGLSEGHFHRAFRAATGLTPLQFVNQRRIEAAKRILAVSAPSIIDLALQVGFTSPSHFARLFRQGTGRNPAQFRRDLGQG